MSQQADSRPAEKDAPLWDDVHALSGLVDQVVVDQVGEALQAVVEQAHAAATARRSGDSQAQDTLQRRIGELTAQEAVDVTYAFSTYFQTVNTAEKVHRLRRGRAYARTPGAAQPFGLEATFRQLHEAGWSLEQALALLARTRLEPVFTAHPTEARRRTLLIKQQWIAQRLVERLDPQRTPQEERALLANIRTHITAAWQTESEPHSRPTVNDELEHVLFFLLTVIYRVIPPFYESIEEALVAVWGEQAREHALPNLLHFASWVGGDMDGNPNVGADTLRETLEQQRREILLAYQQELRPLYRELSQTRSRIGVSEAIDQRIASYTELFPKRLASLPPRHRDMPYRVLLHLMGARLAATLADREHGYPDAAVFAADVAAIHDSLRAHRGEWAGAFFVHRLLRRVQTFGFHLATVDVRQDSLVHRRVIGRLLDVPDWLERSATARRERLEQALAEDQAPIAVDDEECRQTLAVFEAIREAHARHGRQAIGPYIISMAQAEDDVLSVLLLARWAGLQDNNGIVPLDVAPLFETVTDLATGAAVTARLLEHPRYRAHLRARGERQVVMVGYSDSNKDGGFAASRWAVHEGQRQLVAATADTGVELVIFHGRGGTISRGGGKTPGAVLATPRGATDGGLRVTEQGEMISEKYGLRGIATRSFEQTLSAVCTVIALPPADHGEAEQRLMDELATRSRTVYRRLVYDDPRFMPFFRHATPIDVIERMQIGSRPASRRQQQGVQDLRAIPWVFSWSQSRALMTGWYGLGTGLEAALEQAGEQALRELAGRWRFFGNLLADAEMVLAKTDLGIAGLYAELAPAEARPIFDLLCAEYDRTVAAVLRIRGTDTLLAGDPTLQRNIRLRNPYLDPLNFLQVELLTRWRNSGQEDEALFRPLLLSVNGIAQGLQNTG